MQQLFGMRKITTLQLPWELTYNYSFQQNSAFLNLPLGMDASRSIIKTDLEIHYRNIGIYKSSLH